VNNPFCQSRINTSHYEAIRDNENLNERYIRVRELDLYYKCIACDGTGLDNYSQYKDVKLWDGKSICEVCKGKGIFDWVENTMCGCKTEKVENKEEEIP